MIAFHKWREAQGGPELRSIMGTLVARINHTGTRWRATVWKAAGTSSRTANSLNEAILLAEEVARGKA